MSLFGSLNIGAAGMFAQEKSTAIIAHNVANATTTGFRKSHAIFHDLVTNADRATSSSNLHGATSTRILQANRQGPIQSTQSSTDTAINGAGFFAVRAQNSPESEFLFTRNGAFNEDRDGYLRNTAGFILHGWPIDQDGNFPGTGGFGALVPVNVGILSSVSLPTTFGSLSVNLNANQIPIDPHALTPSAPLPVSDQPVHFSRSLTVFDSQGNPRELGFELRRFTGPMAHFTSALAGMNVTDAFLPATGSGPASALMNGDSFSVSVGGASETFTFVPESMGDDLALGQIATVNGLTSAIDAMGGGGVAQAEITQNGRLLVRALDPTATITLTEISGTPLSGPASLAIIPDPVGGGFAYAPEASMTADGIPNPNQSDFPPFADLQAPGANHWWELRVLTADPANPLGGGRVEISKGLINFNTDGTLNVERDADGRALLHLNAIDFDDQITGEEISMSLDISTLTQFAGSYNVLRIDQNGAGAGERTGVQISEDGTVSARFANGVSVGIFRIPLADFANPNGLDDVSGTVFRVSAQSGDPSLHTAGTAGTGWIADQAIENSNVDIADEFGRMIISQKAYALNSRVINAVDEMTRLLAQLKR